MSSSQARVGAVNFKTPMLPSVNPPPNCMAHWPDRNGSVSREGDPCPRAPAGVSDKRTYRPNRVRDTSGLLEGEAAKATSSKTPGHPSCEYQAHHHAGHRRTEVQH